MSASERDRLNAAVKSRFAAGLERHVRLCPICLMRGPGEGSCKVGSALWMGAVYGADVPKKEGNGHG